jgi:biotin operon repressor
MSPDKREILQHLAANRHKALSASAIAAACSIGRTEAAKDLAGLETQGLAQLSVKRSGWAITGRGVDYVRQRVAA